MRTLTVSLVAASFSMAAGSALAESYQIDPRHTSVVFQINHLGFSNVFGMFLEKGGTFTFDAADLTAGAIDVTITAESVFTNDEARDDHLRSPDFFNAVEFPEITFQSTAITPTGENTGTVTGDLTLLGVTAPVTLEVSFNQAAASPAAPDTIVAGFSARGVIKRSDFGMTYGAPALGDEIQLYIEVEGVQQ